MSVPCCVRGLSLCESVMRARCTMNFPPYLFVWSYRARNIAFWLKSIFRYKTNNNNASLMETNASAMTTMTTTKLVIVIKPTCKQTNEQQQRWHNTTDNNTVRILWLIGHRMNLDNKFVEKPIFVATQNDISRKICTPTVTACICIAVVIVVNAHAKQLHKLSPTNQCKNISIVLNSINIGRFRVNPLWCGYLVCMHPKAF